MDMLKSYFLALIPIFVALDALGLIPVFMSLTQGMNKFQKERLVRRSTITALCVAVAFLFVGRFIFALLGITISDFLVAGGAILFIISIRDILAFHKVPALGEERLGVVPLAVPLMVGPAVLTTSLILVGSAGLYPTVFSLIVNVLLCGVILHFSQYILKFLGEVGTQTLSKIFSLLLGAIGIMLIRRGLFEILAAVGR